MTNNEFIRACYKVRKTYFAALALVMIGLPEPVDESESLVDEDDDDDEWVSSIDLTPIECTAPECCSVDERWGDTPKNGVDSSMEWGTSSLLKHFRKVGVSAWRSMDMCRVRFREGLWMEEGVLATFSSSSFSTRSSPICSDSSVSECSNPILSSTDFIRLLKSAFDTEVRSFNFSNRKQFGQSRICASRASFLCALSKLPTNKLPNNKPIVATPM